MTPAIRRILYATDLSPNATYALGHAVNLAVKYGATITVLHVIDKTAVNSQMLLFGYLAQVPIEDENSRKRIDHIHATISHRVKNVIARQFPEKRATADIVSSIEICQGYPADEILKQADALQCDVIVMGTHGKGFMSQAFFGSVAKRVLRRVRIPVFITPLPEEGDVHEADIRDDEIQ